MLNERVTDEDFLSMVDEFGHHLTEAYNKWAKDKDMTGMNYGKRELGYAVATRFVQQVVDTDLHAPGYGKDAALEGCDGVIKTLHNMKNIIAIHECRDMH